jgi:hypothetical protein
MKLAYGQLYCFWGFGSGAVRSGANDLDLGFLFFW